MKVREYIHKVKYYETDKMGITHHSNYIRWMEEARVDFLDQIGFSFVELEKNNIVSPTTEVACKYKESTKFDEQVSIQTKVLEYRGVKLVIEYKMISLDTKKLVFTGKSVHCFTNMNGFPIRLKKILPEFDTKLRQLVEN